jgi:release factor glutamine methyltransferase
VFVPRPETEVVAEAAIAAALRLPAPVVVDLCTGSGAIALSLADEVPAASVHAVESDEAAHAWAGRNCAGTGVDLRLGDMADALHDLDGRVDVVVSNPPYIPVGAHVRDPEVAAHDPALALWSGTDGLDAVRVVEQVAGRLLRPGGTVVVEHADLQGRTAPAVFAATGRWTDVRDHRDLAGRDRYLTAVRADGGEGGVG